MTLISSAQAATLPVLFGTSQGRNSGSKGIYASALNQSSGKLTAPKLVAELNAAGFQILHPSLPVVYSIGASTDNVPGIFAYKLDLAGADVELTLLANQPTASGRGTHLDIDPSGRMLVSAQYGDGTVSVFPVQPDGSLLPTTQVIQHTAFTNVNPNRQEKPHPHNVTFDPSGTFVLIPDLGADAVIVYKVDYETNKLIKHREAKSAPGAGPRHMKFSTDGDHAYVLNELALTVDAYKWNRQTGKLAHLKTVEGLPEKLREPGSTHTASEIRIHPNQRFLYTANRGHNSISVFSIDPSTGVPERIQTISAGVDWPRNFAIDPSGNWLMCGGQFSNDVSVFSVNLETGRIAFIKDSLIPGPGPHLRAARQALRIPRDESRPAHFGKMP